MLRNFSIIFSFPFLFFLFKQKNQAYPPNSNLVSQVSPATIPTVIATAKTKRSTVSITKARTVHSPFCRPNSLFQNFLIFIAIFPRDQPLLPKHFRQDISPLWLTKYSTRYFPRNDGPVKLRIDLFGQRAGTLFWIF